MPTAFSRLTLGISKWSTIKDLPGGVRRMQPVIVSLEEQSFTNSRSVRPNGLALVQPEGTKDNHLELSPIYLLTQAILFIFRECGWQ